MHASVLDTHSITGAYRIFEGWADLEQKQPFVSRPSLPTPYFNRVAGPGGTSCLLLFEFRPARVERLHRFLRFVQLHASVLETHSITGNYRIFECGASGLKDLLGFMDAAFDSSKFSGFGIGQFLFGRRTRSIVPIGPRAPVSLR